MVSTWDNSHKLMAIEGREVMADGRRELMTSEGRELTAAEGREIMGRTDDSRGERANEG